MTNTNRRNYMATFRQEQKLLGFRRVNVTLSPQEYERIQINAVLYGERVTSHLKRCALAFLNTDCLIPPDVGRRLDSLLVVMRSIGNNVNQLARYSHEMRVVLDAGQIQAHLKRMDDEVRRFVTGQGHAVTLDNQAT
jgi:hypothetical protein